MLATLEKCDNSSIRLPKAILETAMMKEDESVEILVERNQIIIKKAKPIRTHKTFKKRLEEHYGKDINTILKEIQDNPEHEFEEWDTGEPVGNDVL